MRGCSLEARFAVFVHSVFTRGDGFALLGTGSSPLGTLLSGSPAFCSGLVAATVGSALKCCCLTLRYMPHGRAL